MRSWLPVLLAMCGPVGAGCSLFDSAAAPYIAASEEVYASLPVYPNATLVSQSTSAHHAGPDGAGPVNGGGVKHVFELPASTIAKNVIGHYDPWLRAHGWRLVERLPGLQTVAGPVLNYRKGSMRISINLEGIHGGQFEIDVHTGP